MNFPHQSKPFITSLNRTSTGHFDYSLLDGVFSSLTTPYDFEKIDLPSILHSIHDFWYIGVIVGLAYILLIFGLQKWMKNRKAYNLKRELFLWNAALGIFSICGFWRVAPEIFHMFNRENGIYRSLCVYEFRSHQTEFWGLLFTLSKFVELGDTIFIVLRKKPLVVLQWYHHFIMAVSCWCLSPFVEPCNIFLVVTNYGVHSLMYPYFALKALNVRIPIRIANSITTLQFLQMVSDAVITSGTGYLYFTGVPCLRHNSSVVWMGCIMLSFNLLFGDLFYKSVILQGKRKQK